MIKGIKGFFVPMPRFFYNITLLVVVQAIALGVLFLSPLRDVRAQTGIDLYGWAWSSSVGWVSFNSRDCDINGDGSSDGLNGCPVAGTPISTYSVKLDSSNKLLGYAWSANIGWLRFGNFILQNFPVADGVGGTFAANAELNPATSQFFGWARSCNPNIVVPGTEFAPDCVTPAKTVERMFVSCSSNPVVAAVGEPVTWTALVSGGNAPYSITWTGTSGLSGSGGQRVHTYATNNVHESATATVTSADGQTGSAYCEVSIENTLASPARIDGNDLPVTYCPLPLGIGGSIGFDFFDPGTGAAELVRSDVAPFSFTRPTSIPAGTYRTNLFTFDGYATRTGVSQPHERVVVEFLNGGAVIARANATTDLDDLTRVASGVYVSDPVTLPVAADSIRVSHARYVENGGPDVSNPNDVMVGCANITPVIQDPHYPAGDGWISLRGTNYGVSINAQNELQGHAWGGPTLGWLSLNCAQGGIGGANICAQADYKVRISNPYTYSLTVSTAPIQVVQGGTVTVNVSGTYSRAVSASDVVNLIVSSVPGRLTVQGLPRCVPISPTYTTCSGSIVLAADASAQTGVVNTTVTANPVPTNGVWPRTIPVTIVPKLPPYILSVPADTFETYQGRRGERVTVRATFDMPPDPQTPPVQIDASAPDNSMLDVVSVGPCTFISAMECEAVVTFDTFTSSAGYSNIEVTGYPVPTNGNPQVIRVHVAASPATLDLFMAIAGGSTTTSDGTIITQAGSPTIVCLRWTSINVTGSCTAAGSPGPQYWGDQNPRPGRSTTCYSPVGATRFPQSATNTTVFGPFPTPVAYNFDLTCANAEGAQVTDRVKFQTIMPKVVMKANGIEGRVRIPVGAKARLTWDIYFAGAGCVPTNGDAGWISVTTNSNLGVTTGSYVTRPVVRQTTYRISCPNGVSGSIILVPQKTGFEEI